MQQGNRGQPPRLHIPIIAGDPRVYIYADMAELADALDSGSNRGNSVEVQVLLSAPQQATTQTGGRLLFFVNTEDLNLRGYN